MSNVFIPHSPPPDKWTACDLLYRQIIFINKGLVIKTGLICEKFVNLKSFRVFNTMCGLFIYLITSHTTLDSFVRNLKKANILV